MVPTSICDSNISTHPLVSTEQFLPALHLHLHPIWGGFPRTRILQQQP